MTQGWRGKAPAPRRPCWKGPEQTPVDQGIGVARPHVDDDGFQTAFERRGCGSHAGTSELTGARSIFPGRELQPGARPSSPNAPKRFNGEYEAGVMSRAAFTRLTPCHAPGRIEPAALLYINNSFSKMG